VESRLAGSCKRALAIRSSAHHRKVVTAERKASPAGDRGCGAAEFGRSWSCSRIANDCRSRQAACGPSRPRAKSARITSKGLAPRRESAGEVKERRKPVRPWQSGDNGGGLPTIGRGRRESACRDHGTGARESASRGAPGDGRRLGSSDPGLVDERAGEASLVPETRGQPRVAGATWDVRGYSRSVIGEDNAPMTRSPHSGAPTSCRPKIAARRITVSRGTEAGPALSSVRPTGVGLPKGGPAPRRRTTRRERASCPAPACWEVPARSTRRKSRAR
jgi:hypothetical protein